MSQCTWDTPWPGNNKVNHLPQIIYVATHLSLSLSFIHLSRFPCVHFTSLTSLFFISLLSHKVHAYLADRATRFHLFVLTGAMISVCLWHQRAEDKGSQGRPQDLSEGCWLLGMHWHSEEIERTEGRWRTSKKKKEKWSDDRWAISCYWLRTTNLADSCSSRTTAGSVKMTLYHTHKHPRTQTGAGVSGTNM